MILKLEYVYFFFISSLLTASQETKKKSNQNEELSRKLIKVFGFDETKSFYKKYGNTIAPPYMLDLYNSLTYPATGVTRSKIPYQAKVIRCFNAKHKRNHFQFHLDKIDKEKESVIEAEFHIFKKENSKKCSLHFHKIELVDEGDVKKNISKRTLVSRSISTKGAGFEIFTLGSTVKDWINNPRNNRGLRIIFTDLSGTPLRQDQICVKLIRDSSRRHKHSPILVVFNSEVKSRTGEENSQKSDGPLIWDVAMDKNPNYVSTIQNQTDEGLSEMKSSNSVRRSRRATLLQRGLKAPKKCSRSNLYVDFVEIGWSSWIISPKGYNAFHCSGTCPFPLTQELRPTNHATVQSIVNAMNIKSQIGRPCCVPDKLHSISLLYYDDNDSVVLKTYDDMVAMNCGCH
uniref:Anti-dorsalizing morphogenetic protein n=1 Tax=Hofstenia miamia TaxID=442651 RepID=A0A068CMD0_HOFMI|nr:anti-dorsalizing morphogenetic protein [Hofstenia miamia]